MQPTSPNAPTFDPGTPRAPRVVRWLIAANIAVYFLQLTLLSAGDVRAALGFRAAGLDAWWTVLTHMFVHRGLAHVAMSVYVLWSFGPRVEARWGPARFAAYYVLCGLGGWFLFLLFAREGLFLGATGATLGVALAGAALTPGERTVLYGVAGSSANWTVAFLFFASLSVAAWTGGMTGSGYLAHTGGLLAGWAYLRMAGGMNIDRLRQRVAPVADEPEDVPPRVIPPRSLPRHRGDRESREVDDIVQQSQAAIAERAAEVSRATAVGVASAAPPPLSADDELNALLDKISARGLDALTPAERNRLQDAARRLRNR